jgi:hypothetical protein
VAEVEVAVEVEVQPQLALVVAELVVRVDNVLLCNILLQWFLAHHT